MVSGSPSRRREPVQDRSRKRVERILTAAVDLLEEGGLDAVTTRAIAARADVPVATVYQFFPNRDAILQEVLSDFISRRDTEGAEVLAGLQPGTLAEAVHELLMSYRDQMRDHPHLVDLFYNSRAIGFLDDPQQSRLEFAGLALAALVEWRLLRADTGLDVAILAIELGDRIVEMAHRAGAEGRDAVLAEGERALTTYLQTYAVTK